MSMTFEQLVERLKSGERVSLSEVWAALEFSGRTPRELVAAFLSGPPRPGEVCPRCGRGRVAVLDVKHTAGRTTRYVGCRACRARLGKITERLVPTNVGNDS